jgi:uncharacterized protein (TIGR01777 family)
VRIIVSGGTGFIGRSLVTTLCERGDDVVVLSRGRSASCYLGARPTCCRGSGKANVVEWTPETPGDWSRIVDGADAVVHLAGAAVLDESWTAKRKEQLRSSRIRSTELLADAMAKAERKPRAFISGSAIGYYGIHTGDQTLTEQSPGGDDFLATLVRDWESAASAARAAGVRVVHPRIGLVLGRSGGLLKKMVPPFRAFVGGPVGHGAQYMSWVHVDDAVRALVHALDTDLAGPFNVTAPEPVTMNEFAACLGRALNRPSACRVPEAAIRLLLGDRADAVLTGPRALPERLVGSGFAFVFPDLTSALADLFATS